MRSAVTQSVLAALVVGTLGPQTGSALGSRLECRASTDAKLVKWGHPAGELSGRASELWGRPFGVRISSTGVVFVTQQDGNSVARIRLDDLEPEAAMPAGADPGDVVVTSDGASTFVSGYNDGTVWQLDNTIGRRVRRLSVAPRNAYRLALSPDDSRLYVTSNNGLLYAVDLSGADSMLSVRLGGSLHGLALGRGGSTLIVSSAEGGVWRLDACTMAVRASATIAGYGARELALAPDETEVFVARESGFVDVLDATTLRLIRRLTLPHLKPFGLAVTPDGTRLYVTSSTTGEIAIVDSRTGEILQLHRVGGMPRRIAFDASGATAVVSNEANWVDVIR